MARPFDRGTTSQDTYRYDHRIRVPEVRVINADGSQLGIMPTFEALKIAEEQGLNLVEVSPKAVPPVCRIMDYGKFKYEQSKQQAKAKKHASTIIIKEVKFRPKTDDHDFEFKVRHIRRFLQEGNKAKLVIVFRGREIVHPETGQAMLKAVFDAVNDIAMIEQNPMMEGRRMLMVLAPKTSSRPSAPPRPITPAPAASPPAQAAPAPAAPPPAQAAPAPAAPPQVQVVHKAPSASAPPASAPRPSAPSSAAARPGAPSARPPVGSGPKK